MAPQDYDMATSARPEEVEALFPQTHAVGRAGVILVVEHGHTFEVATFRASDYTDGRRPNTVTFSDAQTDASRRDFTVNGLFMDPLSDTVHDWVGAGGLGETPKAPSDILPSDLTRIICACCARHI